MKSQAQGYYRIVIHFENPRPKARVMLEMSRFMRKILGNGPLTLPHSPIADLSNLNPQFTC